MFFSCSVCSIKSMQNCILNHVGGKTTYLTFMACGGRRVEASSKGAKRRMWFSQWLSPMGQIYLYIKLAHRLNYKRVKCHGLSVVLKIDGHLQSAYSHQGQHWMGWYLAHYAPFFYTVMVTNIPIRVGERGSENIAHTTTNSLSCCMQIHKLQPVFMFMNWGKKMDLPLN